MTAYKDIPKHTISVEKKSFGLSDMKAIAEDETGRHEAVVVEKRNGVCGRSAERQAKEKA